MTLLEHLNQFFGYEADTLREFVADFKADHKDVDAEKALDGLLTFFRSITDKEIK